MRRRVALQQRTLGSDAIGQQVETWATTTTRWARKVEIGGGEQERANSGQLQAHGTVSFEMRYYSSVTPEWRLTFDGRTFHITNVIHDERRTRTTLMCTEVQA